MRGLKPSAPIEWINRMVFTPRERVDVFLHIPRCGGTTITKMARANYRRWNMFPYVSVGRHTTQGQPMSLDLPACEDAMRIRQHLAAHQKHIDCVLGHIPYGIHQYFDRPCFYFTFIREPVSRVWSAFNFICKNQNHYLNDMVRRYDFDLEELLQDDEAFIFTNEQSRMILGTHEVRLSTEDIDRVVAHVQENIGFVGQIEKLEEDVRRLQEQLGWKRIRLKHENVGSYPQHSRQPPKKVAAAIRRANEVDIALFDYVSRERGPF